MQNLMQDAANFVRKIFAILVYFLQNEFYWELSQKHEFYHTKQELCFFI